MDSVRYLGVTIDNRLKWTEHITTVATKCGTLLRILVSKTKGIYGPKPKLMKWVYTGVVRVKLTYAAMIWGHSLGSQKGNIRKTLLRLNRTASLGITVETRTTPQASLEIMYNIPPLDLHIKEIGLTTFFRGLNTH